MKLAKKLQKFGNVKNPLEIWRKTHSENRKTTHSFNHSLPEIYTQLSENLHTVRATSDPCFLMVRTGVGKCVSGATKIKIRNKKTGEIQELTIDELKILLTNSRFS